MSLTLDLPTDLERELAAEAASLHLPLAEYALRVLSTGRMSGRVTGDRPTNGAELVAYWQREGVVGTRPDIADSQEHAREMRRKAEKRA